jgi:hypothetical protein
MLPLLPTAEPSPDAQLEVETTTCDWGDPRHNNPTGREGAGAGAGVRDKQEKRGHQGGERNQRHHNLVL